MIPVGGRPVLERVLEWLAGHGVTEVALNLHHLPLVVMEHFGDGSSFGVRIRYSPEPQLLGTAGALRPLEQWLADDRFLLVYGDNLIDLDLAEVVARHEHANATLTVALFHRDDPSSSGVAALSADDRIREFREKPPPGEESSKWVNAGLLVCEPRVLDFVPESVPSDFARDVIPALIAAGEPVVGYRMDATDSLHWIDTPQDLEAVHELFRERQASR